MLMAYTNDFHRPRRIDPTAHYIDNTDEKTELKFDADYLVVVLGVIAFSAIGVIAMTLFNNVLKF